MKLLLINQDWLREEFEALGHEVRCVGVRSHMECRVEHPGENINSLLQRLPEPFEPDRIIMYDESGPFLIGGLEEVDIPILFYSVDTHHHCEMHRHYAHLADITLIAQRDYADRFAEVGEHPLWMPLWASKHIEPSDQKKYDAVFVGNMDAKLNPERVTFFEALKERTNIYVTTGEFWNIFPHAEIVVNQTVKGDLNYRVFEAMMSGATLLTESSENGLTDLFTPDEHLVVYEKNNVDDAAQKIQSLLEDKARCRQIGAAGRAKVLAEHSKVKRAEEFDEILRTMIKRESPSKRFGSLVNYNWATRGLAPIGADLAAQSAARGLEVLNAAIQKHERCTTELMCHAIFACLEYDRLQYSDEGKRLISFLDEQYPQETLPRIAKLWCHLNRGEQEQAASIAKEFRGTSPQDVFRHVNHVIEGILSGDFFAYGEVSS